MTDKEATELLTDPDSDYLTPAEFAQKVFDSGVFILPVWDINLFRLGRRVSELMKLGYQPYGNPFSHTTYAGTGTGKQYRIPVKSEACLFMIHRTLYDNIIPKKDKGSK